jgi:ribosomal protein L7/L12
MALGVLVLLSLGAWVVFQWAPGEIGRHLGRPYVAAYFLVLVLAVALVKVRQYHKRGQTIREGLRADRALKRQRRQAWRGARIAPRVLPWLADRQRDPADWPGVVITPAREAAESYPGGYDVVLCSAGETRLRVATQVQKLTHLPMARARRLIDEVPVVVLRVPAAEMASAAKAVLEYAGATASVSGPAEPGASGP